MKSRNQIIKSKTLSDSLRGLVPNQKLMKALKLGDTKIGKDGRKYVVKQTKSGKLDWRLADKSKAKKSGKDVDVNIDDLFDTKDFPKSPDDVKFIQDLGGSTGAKLVEDKNGVKYVLKQGNSKEHAEEEFLSNSIYALMGVDVPTMKLYKGKKDSTILSLYMENTVAANKVMDDLTRDDIAENFVLDCLMSNWDIYKNDNILIDQDTNKIVRVDNGGSLRFSAQGRDKGDDFSGEIYEFGSMPLNNPYFAENLTSAQMKKQAKKILKKAPHILSLIEDKDLKKTMFDRLMDLKDFAAGDSLDDPYGELKERQIKKAYRMAGNLTAVHKDEGFIFLSEICKMRGFDGVPTMVDDDVFDQALKDDKDALMIHRGLAGYGGNNVQKFIKNFAEEETCFYGGKNGSIYGAGIYGAINKSKRKPPPPNPDYEIAYSYAAYNEDNVLDIILPSDAKTIDGDELDAMMNEEFFGKEFKEKKVEYDKAKKEYYELNKKKEREEDLISNAVKQKLGWNEKTFDVLNKSKVEEVYADTKKYPFSKAKNYFKAIVESINGNLKDLGNDEFEISLPNSTEKFLFNSLSADLGTKQKNNNTVSYNYHYTRLKNFIYKEHYKKIKVDIDKEISKEFKKNPKLKKINDEIKVQNDKITTISDDITDIQKNGSNNVTNEIIGEIIKKPGGTNRGFYAAIKGYDAIINKNGWGSNTDFAIILNRSKLIVRKHSYVE